MPVIPWLWDAKRGNTIVAEWEPYRAFLRERPTLIDCSRLPPHDRADAVWSRLEELADLRIDRFIERPGQGRTLTDAERDELAPVARQAFAITLDAAFSAAESGRIFTRNFLFDALALRWSVEYQAAYNAPARSAREMREETIKAVWRELQLVGLRFDELWEAALGPVVIREGEKQRLGIPGLYEVSGAKGAGHTVELSEPRDLYEAVNGLLGPTPAPWRVRRAHKRLLLAEDVYASEDAGESASLVAGALDFLSDIGDYRTQVAAEREYCVVPSGPASKDVIAALEASELYVDVAELRTDLSELMARRDGLRTELEGRGVDLKKPNLRPRGSADVLVSSETGDFIRRLKPEEQVRVKDAQGRVVRGVSNKVWKERGHRIYVLRDGERVSRRRLPTQRERQIVGLGRGREETRALLAKSRRYNELSGQIAAFERVVRELEERRYTTGHVLIRSRFTQTVNRRYQEENFWPGSVSGKEDYFGLPGMGIASGIARLFPLFISSVMPPASRRARWFKFPSPEQGDDTLYDPTGFDISSSQIQILAFFLGDRELERIATSPDKSFKATVAERALKRHARFGIDGERFDLPAKWAEIQEPDALRDMLKAAVMTSLYGSKPDRVIRNLWAEHRPGLGNPNILAERERAEERLRLLLSDDELHLRGIFDEFLPACRAIARKVWDENEYAGITLVDPWDSEAFRWNPFRLRPDRQVTEGHIYVNAPVGPPDKNGDYPVDPDRLERMVAPCFVHALDALFASWIIDGMGGVDVKRDIVSVHDAWFVADHPTSLGALRIGIQNAGRGWFMSLSPMYAKLREYLAGTEHAPWVERIWQAWRERVDQAIAADADEAESGLWPVFRAAPAKMYLTG